MEFLSKYVNKRNRESYIVLYHDSSMYKAYGNDVRRITKILGISAGMTLKVKEETEQDEVAINPSYLFYERGKKSSYMSRLLHNYRIVITNENGKYIITRYSEILEKNYDLELHIGVVFHGKGGDINGILYDRYSKGLRIKTNSEGRQNWALIVCETDGQNIRFRRVIRGKIMNVIEAKNVIQSINNQNAGMYVIAFVLTNNNDYIYTENLGDSIPIKGIPQTLPMNFIIDPENDRQLLHPAEFVPDIIAKLG